MDAVKAFNAELSALYEEPPPITKAKMNAITKGAIKAIKFYKHVVQSVEKFILKCKPEYKVPGLYVIDSIVRQSRHQFGADKDVFARRFSKNMQNTFLNLFRCPPEDKSKVIRVLNLWQKNDVFAPDIIQPLFDLADPNNPIHKEAAASANGVTTVNHLTKNSPAAIRTPTTIGKSGNKHSTDPDCSSPLHASQANAVLGSNQQLQLHLQQLQQLLLRQRDSPSKGPPGTGIPNKGIRNEQFKFDKKLLDYDYSEEEDEGNCSPKGVIENNLGRILSNPDVMRQLQTLQAQMTAQQVSTAQNFLKQTEFEETKRKLLEFEMMKQQEEEFDKHLAHLAPNLPFVTDCELPGVADISSSTVSFTGPDITQPPPGFPIHDLSSMQNDDNNCSEIEFVGDDDNNVVVILDGNDSGSRSPPIDRHRRRRSNSRDRNRRRSRSRSSRRRRSRDRSRDRGVKDDRRERDRDRDRDREREKEKEHERERKKRGLPPIKRDNMSVCSTTLWVGHLSKLVHQEDLSDTFGEYGDIVSIDLIPPRGCAFIVMNRRQDAYRCLTKLKQHKMQGKAITIAWAPGKGMKEKEWKDYWEVELGVSYIPWSKLKSDVDIDSLEDGGMIDEDSMPHWLKERILRSNSNKPKPAPSEEKSELMISDIKTSSSSDASSVSTDLEVSSTSSDSSVLISSPPPSPIRSLSLPKIQDSIPDSESNNIPSSSNFHIATFTQTVQFYQFLPIPERLAVTSVPSILDTSQPPPTTPSMLRMAPAHLSVPPFSIPPVQRLMGSMGLPLPPNLGLPMGVPPPNILGLPAFTTTGAPLVNSIPLPTVASQDKTGTALVQPPSMGLVSSASDTTMNNITDILRVPFGVPAHLHVALAQQQAANMAAAAAIQQQNIPSNNILLNNNHDDNMDIDMDDDLPKSQEKPPISLSDQLLAAISGSNNSFTIPPPNLPKAPIGAPFHSKDVDDRPSGLVTSERNDSKEYAESRNNSRDHRDTRDRNRDDRDRDSRRDRERDQDRNRDRDRRGRDRGGRWLDQDRDSRDSKFNTNSDRNDKSEKSLQERLREMANESSLSNMAKRDETPYNKDRRDFNRDLNTSHHSERPTPNTSAPPSLLDLPSVPPPALDDSSLSHPDGDRSFCGRNAGRNFDRSFQGEIFDSRRAGRDELRPMRPLMNDMDMYEYDMRREDYDRMDDLGRENFDRRMRGPPDFFNPRGDNFSLGPRPQGRPMMMGRPGPPPFGPRGPMPPHMRGPRGAWMDSGRPGFIQRGKPFDGMIDPYFDREGPIFDVDREYSREERHRMDRSRNDRRSSRSTSRVDEDVRRRSDRRNSRWGTFSPDNKRENSESKSQDNTESENPKSEQNHELENQEYQNKNHETNKDEEHVENTIRTNDVREEHENQSDCQEIIPEPISDNNISVECNISNDTSELIEKDTFLEKVDDIVHTSEQNKSHIEHNSHENQNSSPCRNVDAVIESVVPSEIIDSV